MRASSSSTRVVLLLFFSVVFFDGPLHGAAVVGLAPPPSSYSASSSSSSTSSRGGVVPRASNGWKRRRSTSSSSSLGMTVTGGAAIEASSFDDDSDAGAGGGATIANEVFNLVKSIVGAGVLSLPAGIAAFGNAPSALVPATFLIGIIGLISGYTFSLIARVCSLTGARTFSEAWDSTVGPRSSWITAVSCFVDCFGGNLSYSMILGDTVKNLLASAGIRATRSQAMLGITGTMLLPLCLMKNLSSLAPFSLVGIVGMMYTSVAIGIRYFGGAYASPAGRFLPDVPADLQPSFGSIGASGAMSPNALILICMLSTAYIAHFNAPKFYAELKDNTIKRFNVVTTSSFGISVAIYAAVSAMGFLTFGSNCDGLILNNYSTKDGLMSLSRIAVAVSLVFSYPLLFVGTRDGILDLVKIPLEKRSSNLLNNVTLVVLTIVTALALKITDLSFVASISGSTFGTALIFIYPALMFRGAVKRMGDRASKKLKIESDFASVVATLGAMIGAVGTWMATKGVEI